MGNFSKDVFSRIERIYKKKREMPLNITDYYVPKNKMFEIESKYFR